MRAIVLEGDAVYQESRPDPVPGPGEVLVRVLQAGVCETDLQLIKGYMGFRGVLGHEFVGIAESGPFQGRRVVGEINCACQTCATCKAGLERAHRYRADLVVLDDRTRQLRDRAATALGRAGAQAAARSDCAAWSWATAALAISVRRCWPVCPTT